MKVSKYFKTTLILTVFVCLISFPAYAQTDDSYSETNYGCASVPLYWDSALGRKCADEGASCVTDEGKKGKCFTKGDPRIRSSSRCNCSPTQTLSEELKNILNEILGANEEPEIDLPLISNNICELLELECCDHKDCKDLYGGEYFCNSKHYCESEYGDQEEHSDM